MPRVVPEAPTRTKTRTVREAREFEPRRILVIGGTQFIGKLLVSELVRARHEVYILHRRSRHSAGRRVHNLVADRNDAASVRKAVGATRFDIVYDIAYDWE